jgi:glycosyltransferase involved in cell wall biosynthesis
MRILLVGNYVLDNQASMLRYADMLCRHLTLRGHEVEVIRPRVIVGNLAVQPLLRKWLGYVDKYVFFPSQLRSRARDFDLVHVCDHSNSMYLPAAGARPASITCHDLLAIGSAQGRYPQQEISLSGKVQQRWILKHLAAASDVICVSANTARELAEFSGGAVHRVAVIPNMLNSSCSPATEESVLRLRRKLGILDGERYLFHVGGNFWYKNRFGVLHIFKCLTELAGSDAVGLRLVMAGGRLGQEMRDFVRASLPEGSVVEVVEPTDEELWTLYSGATALLFPSLHEGFGWPLIEAQRCGCPVITTDRAPMSEVAGSAAIYIDPADEQGAAVRIAAGMTELSRLREAGFQNARRFDPEVIIPEYESFFAGVARTRRSSDEAVRSVQVP